MEHHKTRIPFLYGYIDENGSNITGWMINIRMRSGVNPTILRAIELNHPEHPPFKYGITRKDVQNVYNLVTPDCGFQISRRNVGSVVQIQVYIFEEWKTVMEIPPGRKETIASQAPPPVEVVVSDKLASNTAMKRDVIVIDEFYEDPEVVRRLALHGSGSVPLNDTRAFLETLVGGKIVVWEEDKNGTFEFHTADNLVYVSGSTNECLYYAQVFLTPNPPCNAGITLYRSKDTKKREFDPLAHSPICRDLTRFEPIDKVGNVYNRLVIWNANLLHSPSCYFGNTKETAHLVQTFRFQVVYA